MFFASVCPSVCPSICLKPKFGRLKPKFDEDAEGGSAKRTPHILEFNIPHGPEKLSSAQRSKVAKNTSSINC